MLAALLLVSVTALTPPEITDSYRWGVLQRAAQEQRVLNAFELFRSEGIEPVLIKGFAAGLYYPEDKPRLATDIDLAVSKDQFRRAERIVHSRSGFGLAIDLHRELRHLDTVEWEDLYGHSRIVLRQRGSIRVLRPEDHLRIVCIHWLTDGGRDRERLWDIYYMVSTRDASFDWSRFLDVVPKHRRRWLECAVGVAAKYLGLELKDTPLAGADERLPRWMLTTLETQWASGESDRPLETSIHDRKLFFRQLIRRFRPNPITATILAEGDLDAPTRVHYKLRMSLNRIVPSIRRMKATLEQ